MKITFAKGWSLILALVSGKTIPKAQMKKRFEICHACPSFRYNGWYQYCGECQCHLSGSEQIFNLIQYEETKQYGCSAVGGSRWKKAGV